MTGVQTCALPIYPDSKHENTDLNISSGRNKENVTEVNVSKSQDESNSENKKEENLADNIEIRADEKKENGRLEESKSENNIEDNKEFLIKIEDPKNVLQSLGYVIQCEQEEDNDNQMQNVGHLVLPYGEATTAKLLKQRTNEDIIGRREVTSNRHMGVPPVGILRLIYR